MMAKLNLTVLIFLTAFFKLLAQTDVYDTFPEDMLSQTMSKAFVIWLPYPHSSCN